MYSLLFLVSFKTRIFHFLCDSLGLIITSVSDIKDQSWQFIYEHAPVAVIEWDTTWCIRAWNSAAEEIFGWKAEEVIGKHFDFLIPEQIKDHIHAIAQDIASQRGGHKSLNQNVKKSGDLIDCQWFNTALLDEKGRTIGAISVAQDVTQDRESRRRLVAYSQLLSELSTQLLKLSQSEKLSGENLESTLLEITKVAAQGLHVARSSCWVLDTNQEKMRNIVTYDLSSLSRIRSPDLSIAEYPIFFESLKKERLIDAHYCRIDSRTKEFTKDYFIPHGISSKLCVATRLRGKPHGMICFEHIGDPKEWGAAEQVFACAIADLVTLAFETSERQKAETEQKRLENQLFQSQKMEALGTMAGGIAHDFNNILAAIMGSTELGLVRSRAHQIPLEQLEIINEYAHRAKDLVQQILSFSKNQTIEQKSINLQFAVEDSLKLIRKTLPPTIELKTLLEAPTGMVLSNPVQIHQVILNICTNAVHACSSGEQGTICIHLQEISFTALSSPKILPHPELRFGDYLKLTISDDGMGIDPETAKCIFDPFFTTKEPGSGSGLGLSIVHSIMNRLQGAVTVDTIPHEGTTFSLYFPKDHLLSSAA